MKGNFVFIGSDKKRKRLKLNKLILTFKVNNLVLTFKVEQADSCI